MTPKNESIDSIFRRTVLKASAGTAGMFALSTTASGDEHDDEGDNGDGENDLDQPDGFEVDILAEHAPFSDDLATTFDLTLANESTDNGDEDGTDDDEHDDGAMDDDADSIAVELDDASTVLFGEVNWEPDGTSGWHRHPGVVIVNVVEGEVEVTWEHDCVPRTYVAGESFFDPGEIHIADSGDGARAFAAFLGIPDGEPATEWVEPVDC